MPSATITLANIAALKAFDTSTITEPFSVEILGYYEEGDGGGGLFYWNSNPLTAINNNNGYSPNSQISIIVDPILESLGSGSQLDFQGGGVFTLTANVVKHATTLVGNLTNSSVTNSENAFLRDNSGTVIESDNTNSGRWIFANNEMANQLTFGAKCAKTENDTSRIQAFFDFLASRNIKKAPFASVDFINMDSILLTSPIEIDLQGCTFIGDESDEFFDIQTNNVSIYNGFFGEEDGIGKKRIATFSFWTSPSDYGGHAGLSISNVTYIGKKLSQAIFINAGTSNIQITNSSFIQKNSEYELKDNLDLKTAIYVTGGTESSFEFDINLTISDCYFEGWLDAWSGNGNGYSRNSIFNGNKVFNCQRGLNNYHCRNSIITNNIFEGSIHPISIWRSHQTSGNYFINSKSNSHTIRIEAVSGIFSNNVIKNSLGSGLLLDGGGSDGLISNNFITNCGKSGIIMDAEFQFGGQFKSTIVQNNKIYSCGENGIFGGSYKVGGGDSRFRDVEIKGNYIAGISRKDIRLATTNVTIDSTPTTNGNIVFSYAGNDVTILFEANDSKNTIGTKIMTQINAADLSLFCFFEQQNSKLIFSRKGVNNLTISYTTSGIILTPSNEAIFLVQGDQKYSGIRISTGSTGQIANLFLNDNFIKGNVANQISDSDLEYGIYLNDETATNASSFNVQSNHLIAPIPFMNERVDGNKIFIRNTVSNFSAVSVSNQGNKLVDENLDLLTYKIIYEYEGGDFTLFVADKPSESSGIKLAILGSGSFAKYTRIGNVVTVIIMIKNMDTITNGLDQGNTLRIFGLPYNPDNETYITVFPVAGLSIPGDVIFGEIPTGGNMRIKTRGSVSRDIKVSDVTSGANEICFNFSYLTSN